jgi:hypothetical protein
MNTITTRLITGAAGVVTIGALALGGAAAANAATPTPTPSASSSASSARATTGVPFRAISRLAIRAQFGEVPSALVTDITALAGKKGSDRRTAVEAIENMALDGGYGSDVKSAASAAKTAFVSEPASLRQDLRALRGKKGTDRAAALAAIDSSARDGKYGAAIESWAKTVQGNVEKQQAARLPSVVGAVI